MKKQILVLALVLVSTLFLYGCTKSATNMKDDAAILEDTREESQDSILVPTDTTEVATGSQTGVFSLSDVSMHKDASSCRSTINGNVYDLTAWIPQHPGGKDAILQLCGKDGTKPFEAMHGGKKLQADTLAGFKIGTLSQ